MPAAAVNPGIIAQAVQEALGDRDRLVAVLGVCRPDDLSAASLVALAESCRHPCPGVAHRRWVRAACLLDFVANGEGCLAGLPV